jgi:hypothetical protein
MLSRMTSRTFCNKMPSERMRGRVDDDAALLYEAADAGDLGDSPGLGQTEADRRPDDVIRLCP